MNISKHDIGAEIVSILTKGMYPDPRDALREYVQNGVDADAKNIEIKIRLNSVVVEDDGHGMNEETLRNSVRLGISEKILRQMLDLGVLGYIVHFICVTNCIFIRNLKKKGKQGY